MRRSALRNCFVVFSSTVLVSQGVSGWAEKPRLCDLSHEVVQEGFRGNLGDAAAFLARTFGVSLIIEVDEPLKRIEIPSGKATLSQVATYFGGLEKSACAGSTVFHLYTDKALRARDNALNFEFQYFEIPTDLDLFELDLRGRLREEPWRQAADGRQLIQPGQGYVSPDHERFALTTAVIRKATARQLLVRVATEQQLISLLVLPLREEGTAKANWAQADATWTLRAVR